MHTWRQSWWSGNHNLHWLAHPSHSAPRIHPRTCRQQWTSSCPKGQFEPLFHPETKGFFSHLFPGVKEDRGSVSYHRSLLLESPSGHSTVQDGNPGISQVVHQREQMDCVHWHMGRISAHLLGKSCTEILPVLGQRFSVPIQLGHLPSVIYQGGQVAPKGSNSMFTWNIGFSAPHPLYRPELMPIWSCECCST